MNKVEIKEVTPEMAKGWLENKFEGQRKMRTSHINKLTAEIHSNKWCMNNDAITLINGKLANGQHRCMAIVQANKSIPLMVLESDDANAFDAMDSGVTRSMTDVLNFHGFGENSITLAPSAKFIIAYDRDLITWRGIADGRNRMSVEGEKVDVVTRSEVLKFCQDNKESLTKYSDFVKGFYKDNPYLLPSYAIAFLFIASRTNEAKALEFIRAVYQGDTQDVAFELRERLIKNKVSKTKLPKPTLFGLLIKSYNMYLCGHVPGHLKVGNKEDFPRIEFNIK